MSGNLVSVQSELTLGPSPTTVGMAATLSDSRSWTCTPYTYRAQQYHSTGNTGIIDESALALACNALWAKACEHSITVKSILHISSGPSDLSVFPYALPDELEAARWEDETMSVLLRDDPEMLGPKAWHQDHHQLHWAKLLDESLCRAYIQFSLMRMCHQQEVMKALLQGVAGGSVLQGLLLTTRDQLFEDDSPLETVDAEELNYDWTHGAEECCLRWKTALANFFDQGTQELEALAVTALREMRKWTQRPSTTRKSGMESVILCSGLGHEILWISNPRVGLENRTPYLSLSFQRYRWKESLLSCLLPWVDRVLPPRIQTSQCSNANAREFLRLLSRNHACPFRSNYSSVFAFSSKRCFLAEAVRWMLPTLAAKAPSVTWICKASLNHLFCLICGFSVADLDSLHLDEELHLVLKLSAELRSIRRELSERFHTKFHKSVDLVTRGCRACYHQPEDSKCVRYWTVEPSYHSEIHGKVVTPYPANDPDRLPPTGKGRVVYTDYVPLMGLGLKKISRHADVLAHCGRDVTLLVDASSPNTVLAGVSFDTFSHQDLQKIHHEASAEKETKAIKQGSQFRRFEWGRMHPIGSRKPTGGKPGDTYTSYTGMEVTDTSHIKLLFAHAADVERMVAAITPVHPQVAGEL
ncbi:uncharacterized protein HD556DRAFT_1450943 [Suillus plorans]|uniref:Uncharacterized protein n=1 Tax=Suillus plorans TaxID=116603 RepID=A0A9P7DB09_9AGAM|nr:uncharacterized protein HD556DRAFT_1450943 [Suillus plorans]KAG1785191.1 hypothetical protein HD556DRAFT_1450943 [Suillus plorans]